LKESAVIKNAEASFGFGLKAIRKYIAQALAPLMLSLILNLNALAIVIANAFKKYGTRRLTMGTPRLNDKRKYILRSLELVDVDWSERSLEILEAAYNLGLTDGRATKEGEVLKDLNTLDEFLC
jgi:hypothetical protein